MSEFLLPTSDTAFSQEKLADAQRLVGRNMDAFSRGVDRLLGRMYWRHNLGQLLGAISNSVDACDGVFDFVSEDWEDEQNDYYPAGEHCEEGFVSACLAYMVVNRSIGVRDYAVQVKQNRNLYLPPHLMDTDSDSSPFMVTDAYFLGEFYKDTGSEFLEKQPGIENLINLCTLSREAATSRTHFNIGYGLGLWLSVNTNRDRHSLLAEAEADTIIAETDWSKVEKIVNED